MIYRPMPDHLTTARLRLSPWVDVDVQTYRELVGERGDGLPTAEDVQARLAAQRATTASTGIALLLVRRLDPGDIIGYCGLVVGRASADEPEIAYELFRRVHGCGYATEAARAVLEAAVRTGRRRLWATVGTDNVASLRVLDKLGFEPRRTTVDDRGELVWLTRALP